MNCLTAPVVVVAGSLHYDIMVDAPDRPRKGETVAGLAWRPKFGGKGGNQAVAAAAAGATVRMWGAVGDDDFGRFLKGCLAAAKVDGGWVTVHPDQGSGMSVAVADSDGDYGAVIVSGANLHPDPASLADAALWQGAVALILQNEIPEDANVAAARTARSRGAFVVLNAAPFRPMSEAMAPLVDLLIVNAIEAEQGGGGAVETLHDAAAAAQRLARRFPRVVVTAGEQGVAGVERGSAPTTLPALPVPLVSTHGAGDTFVGALVAALARGTAFSNALDAANRAAAAHVSRPVSAALGDDVS
ncbi:ribokinase [Paracoccus suum]|uniref:Ribokinase n=1 Tax=Paracoccus suum TaxID=2259340 RepID=A0A344PMB8_9RHOB|nr:PfkB family carbohydrate kinase [Paracoccus suum]AXC50523.1 ribokinase [Paracoccus suum]